MNIYLCLESEEKLMLRIVKCSISRYCSILSMTMEISRESNCVAICGQNNVGKTNTLRGINLFSS